MPRQRRVDDGRQRVEIFRRLDHGLTDLLAEEVERIRAGEGEYVLNRAKIQALFDEVGLGESFELDFGAPINEFLTALQRIHEALAIYVAIYEPDPSEPIDLDELERLELPEDRDAED